MAKEAIEFLTPDVESDYDITFHHDQLCIKLPFLTNARAIKNVLFDTETRIVTVLYNENMKTPIQDDVFIFNKSIKSIDTVPDCVEFKMNVLSLLKMELYTFYYDHGKLYILFKIIK